jgi:dTMP kinase
VLTKSDYKGKLIVVEGIDGSGKSTQIDLLYKWLKAKGYSVFFTEWNSSALVNGTARLAKDKKMFTPTTFSLLFATDFADRWENYIMPLLKAGVIVLADRYAFTAFARDVARGVDHQWVRNLYSFAPQPDLALYYQVPVEKAVERIMAGRSKIKYYEAGMDVGLAENRVDSFTLFQKKIKNEYDNMIDEYAFTVFDATRPVEDQQKELRKIVKGRLKNWEILPHPTKKKNKDIDESLGGAL